MANDYATVSELKERAQIAVETYDSYLQAILDAAAKRIDRFCRRPDGFVADSSASARTYAGSGDPVQWIDECVAITQVAVKDAATDTTYTAWTTDDWIAGRGDPSNPDFNHTPYQFLIVTPWGDYSYFTSGRYTWPRGFPPDSDSLKRNVPTVQVTARWGYAATVPDDIREATLMLAVRWWKRFQGGMSDTLASGELGSLMYTMRMDPDVAGILTDGGYVKRAIG